METNPWKKLVELLKQDDIKNLEAFLKSIPPSEITRILTYLEAEDQKKLLTIISPEVVADLIEHLPDVQAADLIEMLHVKEAASILNEMQSDEQADLLSSLHEDDALAILAEMEPEEAADARRLIKYEPDVAGGLMITEYLAFKKDAVVQDVIEDMTANSEKYSDYNVQYIYVISNSGRLVGVLRFRDLLLSPKNKKLLEIMIKHPVFVSVTTGLDELLDLFESKAFFGIPVIDEYEKLVGVVFRSDVAEAIADRADFDHLKSQGIVGGDELRTMPIILRSRRRLSWLSVNILLNIIAASVIAAYQDTLSAVITLAVFLPIISDMSGCSGNQAVAVSLRELTLGIIKPLDLFRVLLQEASVGLINGIVLGLLIAAAAWLWKGNPFLGLVVGSALMINTLVAVLIGGSIPLILKKMQMDPALASSPILTTITDMLGFFLVLSFASALLPQLAA